MFHRAILMSGSSFSTWSLVEDPVHYAVKVANSLNCSVPSNMMKNHQDIVKCLREKPLADLMSVEVTAPSFLTAMGPSRDGVLIPSDFGTSSIHIRWEGGTLRSVRALQTYGPISGRGCLLDEPASQWEACIYIRTFATHGPISVCVSS